MFKTLLDQNECVVCGMLTNSDVISYSLNFVTQNSMPLYQLRGTYVTKILVNDFNGHVK